MQCFYIFQITQHIVINKKTATINIVAAVFFNPKFIRIYMQL